MKCVNLVCNEGSVSAPAEFYPHPLGLQKDIVCGSTVRLSICPPVQPKQNDRHLANILRYFFLLEPLLYLFQTLLILVP